MKRKSIIMVVMVLAALSPLLYLLFTWSSVPTVITTRFEFDNSFEKIQSRKALLFGCIALTVVSIVIFLLMFNLKRFDPKVTDATPTSSFHKLGLIITSFLIVINYFLIFSAIYAWVIDTRTAAAFFGLLVLFIGNYMNNLKPNYIAGIRLPWTLHDPENWRKTHLLTGKLWFAAGVLMILTSFFIPKKMLGFFLTGLMMLIVVVPGIYSYKLYKNKSN